MMVEITITKMTAPPMPTAVDVFLETPRNGQMPRNFANTMLLMKMVEMMITRYSILNRLRMCRLSFFQPSHYGNDEAQRNESTWGENKHQHAIGIHQFNAKHRKTTEQFANGTQQG